MDAPDEIEKKVRMIRIFLKMALLLMLGFGWVRLVHAAPDCDCVSSEYFSSEILPIGSIATSCPDWPAAIVKMGLRGTSTSTPVVQYQGGLYLNAKAIPYVDGTTRTFSALIKGTYQTCQEVTHVSDKSLSGWNIVILNRWYTGGGPPPTGRAPPPKLIRLAGNIVATLSSPVFFPLEETAANQVQAFFQAGGAGTPPAVPGLQFAAFPKAFSLSGAVDPVYLPSRSAPAGGFLTKTLLADIQGTLQKNGWGQFTAGMVKVGGQWWPAVVKLYGKPGKVYAYYGRFTDAGQAKQYGFSTSDQLYFSKEELVPDAETELFERDLRFGSKIFLRDEAVPNRASLEWHTECRCSDLPFDPDTRNQPKVDANGNWTPIGPGNVENQNSPLFRDCPDERTYFSLYQMCVETRLKEDHPLVDLKGRVDYGDYLASKVAESPAYKSIHPDGTLDGEDLSVSNMPETPAYYDHAGTRLNPTTEDLMDPLDPNTVFFGFRYGPKSLTDWEGPKRNAYGPNPKVRAVVTDMRDFYETKVSQGKEALLALFNITYAHGQVGTPEGGTVTPLKGPVQVTGSFKSLSLILNLDDPASLDQPMKLLNPSDKYLEYKSARTFITQSMTGRPLMIHKWVDGKEWDDVAFGSDLDDLHFRVYWTYGLFAIDRHGDPTQVGTLTVSNTFWVNKDEDQKLVGKWTSEVHMEGGSTLSSADVYNLSSREAHTDLHSLHDRDPVTFEDKSDAMARIAFYIAVSEGLDMAMKWIYDQKDRPYIYEAAKRVENLVAVKQTAKLAYTFYRSYVEWRRLMDILAEIRDSRRALERAFSRFKRSGSLLSDYFVNLDYSKIRPTNVADLFPTRAIRYFDWSTQDLQNELVHFESSLHALNLDLDRFMDGPGKRTLAYMYRETAGSMAQVTAQNDRDRETTHGALRGAQAALGRGGDNTSNYLRLSALTRLALQKTRNTEVKSLEASTSGLRNVLIAIQSDSRDWLTMQDYVTHNLAGSPGAFLKAYQDKDPDAITKQFDVHPIFRNNWVDDKVESGGGP